MASMGNPQRHHSMQKHLLSDYLYLVKGFDNGRKAWYYVLVDQNLVDEFLNALNRSSIHLEDYSKILYSAYGEEPPSSITDLIRKEYGLDD